MSPRKFSKFFLAIALAAAIGTEDAAAQPNDPMARHFAAWMEGHGVQDGALAVMAEGRLVYVHGFGARRGDSRTPIWSLSKFITGACAARLIEEKRMALDDRLGRVARAVLGRFGIAPDGPLGNLTIGQLLTHRSGLPRNVYGEGIVGLRDLLMYVPPEKARFEEILRSLMAVSPQHDGAPQHEYSNSNYNLLGVAIAAAAGMSYFDYCGRAVLEPVGIAAPGPGGRWSVLHAAGGWELSPPEYLAFIRAAVYGDKLLSPLMQAWMRDPSGKAVSANSPIFYSLGVMGRTLQKNGMNFFHTGSWRYQLNASYGKIDESHGTFFVAAHDKVAWFASYSPRPGSAALKELDQTLWRARREVTQWPPEDRFPEFLRRR